MKETFIHFAEAHLYLHGIIILIAGIAISVFVIADLIVGCFKSKKRGEKIESLKMRMGTGPKLLLYYSIFLCAVMLDLVVCIVTPIPVFSMGCAVFMAAIEIFSMLEGTTKKAEIARGAKTVRAVIENPSDISRGIAVAVLKEIERISESKDAPPPMNEADIAKLLANLMKEAKNDANLAKLLADLMGGAKDTDAPLPTNEAQEAPEADNATE